MEKDVYTYLKSKEGKLYYSNEPDGKYEEVDEETITSDAASGQKVYFQCEGGISSIEAIKRAPDSPKAFTDEGVNPVNSTCWVGTIRELKESVLEKYIISWTDEDGKTYTLDPCANGHT